MDETATMFSQWAHYVLVWVGFGTLVGLLAKAVFPGRDPGGAASTLIIGILGSVIGAGVLAFFTGKRVTPISVVGFVVAVAGTAVILFSYRLLNGKIFKEGMPRLGWKRGRRKVSVIEQQ